MASEKSSSTRRHFLKKSSMLAAAGCIAPYFSWNEKAFANDAANDRPLIACIGLGGMGTGDAHELREFGDISAVCDVDANFAEAAKHDPNIGQGKSDVYQDYRKVLERNDVDVVSIVTPDHWHVKMAIEALQAGKHVFCQKPLTLTLEENQLIRNACNKYNKQIFVVGTQQRSDSEKFLRAVNMVQKGLLGDIHTITAGLAGAGAVGGPFAKLAPPAELNWDMWLGQAPKVDYIKERSHFQFRWWYEYSGGKFTDWGAHHVDIATWALGQDQLGLGPIEVDGSQAELPVPYKDGYPTVDDCFNTASEYVVTAKYANGATLVADSRSENGLLIEGTKGRIFVGRGKISGKPIDENWDAGQYTDSDRMGFFKGKPVEGHKANFFRCIREGGLPVSDVFSHVQAMNTCHLMGIAARLQRRIQWDPRAEKIVGDEQAAAFFARTQRAGFEIPRV